MKTVLTLLFAALALAGCATAKPVQSPASSAGAQPAARQQLADVPFFLKGRDYTVDFVATAQDGRTATAQASVHLNR